MGDWETRQMDAEYDMYLEEINHKTEDDIRYDAFEKVDKEILEENYYLVINNYNLENYVNKIDEWKALSSDSKLEYCYDLLYEDPSDDFSILRQVDVFQKLVNLDFEKFDYFDVLKCAFFEHKTLDDIEYISGSKNTINIPFHPLITDEHYKEYIKQLRKNSMIKSLSIPPGDEYHFLKDSLFIWFRHRHYDDTSYSIAQLFDKIIDPTTITRRLDKLKSLII